MADQTQTPEAVEPEVEKTSRIKDFTTKHPRAAKVAAITGAAAAVVAVVAVVKNKNSDSSDPADAYEGELESTPETN
jgi:negative regulator of sigma E activity